MEKNKKLIAIFIMVIAVLSISTGTFLLINNKDKESGKEKDIEEEREEIKNNEDSRESAKKVEIINHHKIINQKVK